MKKYFDYSLFLSPFFISLCCNTWLDWNGHVLLVNKKKVSSQFVQPWCKIPVSHVKWRTVFVFVTYLPFINICVQFNCLNSFFEIVILNVGGFIHDGTCLWQVKIARPKFLYIFKVYTIKLYFRCLYFIKFLF
jgi:hypothetical protein